MIKTTIKRDSVNNVHSYPSIKEHKTDCRIVLLFNDCGYGIILNSGVSNLKLGYVGIFDETKFKPFNGEITISNKA